MRGSAGPAAVYVVAANSLLREALVRLLSGKGDLRVCGANHFSPSTPAQILSLKPDVVVQTPAWNDLELDSTRAIYNAMAAARILMIEMEDDEALFFKAVQAGAMGYLLRDATTRELLEAVRRLAQNLVVCPQHLEWALFRAVAGVWRPKASPAEEPRRRLTPREQELLSLVLQGLTNKEIGARLNLSEYTVKNHVHRILGKTGAGNRMALARLAASGTPSVGEPEAAS